jgi:hypothetical protein
VSTSVGDSVVLNVTVLASLIETLAVNEMNKVCEREMLKTEMLLEMW